MRFRFAWLLLTASCGGKMLVDADAGDAAIVKDASEAATSGDGGGLFECGETGHFIACEASTQYCQLVKTSKSRDYSCQSLPASCTTPASSPYDCGCYQSGDEIFVTICK